MTPGVKRDPRKIGAGRGSAKPTEESEENSMQQTPINSDEEDDQSLPGLTEVRQLMQEEQYECKGENDNRSTSSTPKPYSLRKVKGNLELETEKVQRMPVDSTPSKEETWTPTVGNDEMVQMYLCRKI